MAYINASPTWSAGITLGSDEDWQNDSAVAVRLSRKALSGTARGGVLLRPGQVYPFNAGDTVYCRCETGAEAPIWREAL
ncbi:hypothetical protein ACR03S_10040 [Limimaricola variabilis]